VVDDEPARGLLAARRLSPARRIARHRVAPSKIHHAASVNSSLSTQPASGRRTIQRLAPLDSSKFHPKARQLFAYWLRIHPADRLPGRQHLQPAEIPELLPNLCLVEVHREPARFRYRLTGSFVDARHGRCLTGCWLDEIHAGTGGGAALLQDYRQVVTARTACWRRGPARVLPSPLSALVEALRLPLASDGETIDMILEISLYFDARGRETVGSALGKS
jgi:hypothetical protein